MIEATSCGGVVIFRGKILLLYLSVMTDVIVHISLELTDSV